MPAKRRPPLVAERNPPLCAAPSRDGGARAGGEPENWSGFHGCQFKRGFPCRSGGEALRGHKMWRQSARSGLVRKIWASGCPRRLMAMRRRGTRQPVSRPRWRWRRDGPGGGVRQAAGGRIVRAARSARSPTRMKVSRSRRWRSRPTSRLTARAPGHVTISTSKPHGSRSGGSLPGAGSRSGIMTGAGSERDCADAAGARRAGRAAAGGPSARPPAKDALIAGPRPAEPDAPMAIDGPVNGEIFLADVEHVPGPMLRPGDFLRRKAPPPEGARVLLFHRQSPRPPRRRPRRRHRNHRRGTAPPATLQP